MAGTWSNLGKQPGVSIDTMLLLTDGRVFCHEFQSSKWHTLTPSNAGDDGNGSGTPSSRCPTTASIPKSFGGPANAMTFARRPCWPTGACSWLAASTTWRTHEQ